MGSVSDMSLTRELSHYVALSLPWDSWPVVHMVTSSLCSWSPVGVSTPPGTYPSCGAPVTVRVPQDTFICPWQNTWWWLQHLYFWLGHRTRNQADIFRDHAAAQWCHLGLSFFLCIHPQQLGFSSWELTSHHHQKTVSALNVSALYNHVQCENTGQPLGQLSLLLLFVTSVMLDSVWPRGL